MTHQAAIAQLGERQTEDLKVPGSIPGLGIYTYLPLHFLSVCCAYFSQINAKLKRRHFVFKHLWSSGYDVSLTR